MQHAHIKRIFNGQKTRSIDNNNNNNTEKKTWKKSLNSSFPYDQPYDICQLVALLLRVCSNWLTMHQLIESWSLQLEIDLEITNLYGENIFNEMTVVNAVDYALTINYLLWRDSFCVRFLVSISKRFANYKQKILSIFIDSN